MKKLLGCLFLSTSAFAQITVIPSVTMGAVTGSASLTTVGAIPYVTSSGVLGQDQTANGQLFWDATNHKLGLGTNTPISPLHVRSGTRANVRMGASSSFGSDTAGDHYFDFRYFESGNYAQIESLTSGVSYRSIAIAPNGGNVGIGTINPLAKLHSLAGLIYNDVAITGTTSLQIRAGAADVGATKLMQGFLNDGTTEKWNITRDGSATFSGATNSLSYQTATNCSSAASPAVCSSAAAGSFVVAAAASTVTINTTAVTANSQILVLYDSSLGTKLGVTCNTTEPALYGVTARVAATSFTVTASSPVTNPACFSFFLIN